MNDHSAKEPTKRGTMDYGHDWRGLDDLSGSERTKSLNSWYYPTLAREEFAFWLFTAVSSLLAGWAEAWLFLCGEGEIPPHRIPSLGCGCIFVFLTLFDSTDISTSA
jgi:hypothetical protein